jgi:hypothetical protein
VTLLPFFNFDRLMVELPGTVMPSSVIEVHAVTAAGIAEYSVT